MLTAHANTSATDFIAQLRTYVIAMGLSPMVVDCVDELADADELEAKHHTELQELEFATMEETRNDILNVVEKWMDKYGELSESQRASLLNAIRDA